MKLMSFGASPSAAAAVPAAERASAGEFTHVGAPAGELPWLEIELPTPPSVNRFMGKLGNRSPIVKAWIIQADKHFYLNQAWWTFKSTKLVCPFEAEIIFKRDRSDFHNRLKPLFDWLQRVELIQNDRDCEKLTAMWGDAPLGVRVRLRPWCPQ